VEEEAAVIVDTPAVPAAGMELPAKSKTRLVLMNRCPRKLVPLSPKHILISIISTHVR